MPKYPEDAKPESWQRFFAVSANNRAWELAEMPREQVDVPALLDAAHAAAWHWRAAGNALNIQRAVMLLAQAHALAGWGPSALAYANEMKAYFTAASAVPDWELAFAHAIHAHAAHVAGDPHAHATSYSLAETAVAGIADPEDRALVLRLFEQVPKP